MTFYSHFLSQTQHNTVYAVTSAECLEKARLQVQSRLVGVEAWGWKWGVTVTGHEVSF